MNSQRRQLIGIFACQSVFLTLGKPSGFETLDDYYRFASDCGFETVSVPVADPLFNLDKATESNDYVTDLDGHVQDLGFIGGLSRLEIHTIGQNVDAPASKLARDSFSHFLDSKNFRKMSRSQVENKAKKLTRQVIDVAARNKKLRSVILFMGGKAWSVGQAKWPAWPKYFPDWVIASHVYSWEPILEYAAERGVTLHPEFGHPANTLLTGQKFVVFHGMLSEKARLGLGLQVDGSHFVNVCVDPIPHMKVAVQKTNCKIANHYKWGASVERNDGTCSPYGGWDGWSDASTTFFTIGTVGSTTKVRQFHQFVADRHAVQEDGVDIYCEGECVGITNPKQAMKIGALNCYALRDGTELYRLNGYDEQMINGTSVIVPTRKRGISAPEGRTIGIQKWEGGPFDAAFDSPLKPYELLGLNKKEIAGTRLILERAGLTRAANI